MMDDILDGKNWHIENTDCITHMSELPPASVDFSVFSPPFPALYSYTDQSADIGNSENLDSDAKLHLSFFYRQLARIVKPGRVVMVHVMQIPRMKRVGGLGLCDFRGMNIRIGERAGLVYEYDWSVRKNPQAQALRTKSRELQFAGLETDRAKSRGCLHDYLIKFRAPGDNAVPIRDTDHVLDENEESIGKADRWNRQVTRNDWINFAEGTWSDIIETDTLNTAEAKSEEDVRHICPLQLEVIRRLVLLYSNPGEIVFSPFAGIGSEGYMSIGGKSPKTGRHITEPRRFYGCELKDEYHKAALANLTRAQKFVEAEKQLDLFNMSEPEAA